MIWLAKRFIKLNIFGEEMDSNEKKIANEKITKDNEAKFKEAYRTYLDDDSNFNWTRWDKLRQLMFAMGKSSEEVLALMDEVEKPNGDKMIGHDKGTGITRPAKGVKKWVELWVGDVIKCRVYITDRAGCYLWINEAEVFWEKDYGQYSIRAKYNSDSKEVDGIFALREVLRRDIEFIIKVPRV